MTQDSRTCYFPNHDPDENAYPCTSDTTTSCCGGNSICLSNGYCLDVVQPFVLSRGSCTSDNWGSGCPTHCDNVGKDTGMPIIYHSYDDGITKYCCGSPIYDLDAEEMICPYGDSFTIDDAEIIPGSNALVNVTTLSATNETASCPTIHCTNNSSSSDSSSNDSSICATSSSGSHDIALGAGLGVPLGVIALGSFIWAFMERRRANRLNKSMAGSTSATTGFAPVGSEPSELDTSPQMAELDARN